MFFQDFNVKGLPKLLRISLKGYKQSSMTNREKEIIRPNKQTRLHNGLEQNNTVLRFIF